MEDKKYLVIYHPSMKSSKIKVDFVEDCNITQAIGKFVRLKNYQIQIIQITLTV